MKENKVPTGTTKEEIKEREKIIQDFYLSWKIKNPSLKRFNLSLNEYVNIRSISIEETSQKAARNYLSTLAVLQLDFVLTNAKKISIENTKPYTKNQNSFEKMILMQCKLEQIGTVKLTVGVRRSNKEKVQYCITVINAEK